jgi:hypothetical protein
MHIKLIPVILLLLLFSTGSIGQKNVYVESNYILVRVDSTNEGLDRKFFIYKYDTARKMVINYFFDGARLMKTYIFRNQLDGPCEMYFHSAELMQKDYYRNGRKLYTKTYYKTPDSGKLFKNGKQVPLTKKNIDSLMKKN